MKKFFSLSQCFLLCATLLFSFKSFADCPVPGSGITSSTTCTGNITTAVDYVDGIYLDSAGINTVNMTGNITTSGNATYGIFLNLDDTNDINTVNMTGDIMTRGLNAYGIFSNNSFISNINTVNMRGNITTEGNSGDGITLRNTNGINNTNILNMIGDISTSGSDAYGIFLKNTGVNNNTNTNTVNMTGNITTIGDNAYGISLNNNFGTNDTNTVNMTGNITTTGANALGIYLFNDSATNNSSNTVNMTGDIRTDNELAYGIDLYNYSGSNNSNTVNMTGDITTGGLSAFGIILTNSDTSNNSNTVNMTGNITTSGYEGIGIYLQNSDTSDTSTNTVNMTGNITTSNANALGIYLRNDLSTNTTNTINMTGNIETNGFGDGISLYNNSGRDNINTVNMTGNITTTGEVAFGIYLLNNAGTNNTNTVNIAGHISATGSNSYAIYSSNSNSTNSNTVQLNKGSSVIGGILGEGTHTANNLLKLNLGAGASYDFVTEGFTVTDLNGRPMVTGSAYAAGVGNITTASQSLYERTSQITQSLDDRLRTYDLGQNTDQPYWINTYYSDSSRGGEGLSGSNLSFNQYRSGITAGFNVENSYTPTELVVNYEYGKLNIDDGNQSIQSNSIMAGALFPDIKKLFNGTLSAKALVGYSDFNGVRKVLTNDVAYDGSRNVTASYHSTHLTLGSAWTKTLYQTDKIILDTLVGVDLNTQHINSYSESDLFKWNGRTINQLQERVSLGMQIKPMVKPLTLFGRVGIERRDLLSGENQNFTINNTAVSYKDSNQRNTYATLNAGAYYPLTPTIRAYAQVRYYDSDKNIDSLSGNFGISGQF